MVARGPNLDLNATSGSNPDGGNAPVLDLAYRTLQPPSARATSTSLARPFFPVSLLSRMISKPSSLAGVLVRALMNTS